MYLYLIIIVLYLVVSIDFIIDIVELEKKRDIKK
jgi:hypothetical protein